MNVLTRAKRRAERRRQSSMRLNTIDDDTIGLWAKKRARQARDQELVRSGVRTPQSMFLFSPEIMRTMKVRHRTQDF